MTRTSLFSRFSSVLCAVPSHQHTADMLARQRRQLRAFQEGAQALRLERQPEAALQQLVNTMAETLECPCAALAVWTAAGELAMVLEGPGSPGCGEYRDRVVRAGPPQPVEEGAAALYGSPAGTTDRDTTVVGSLACPVEVPGCITVPFLCRDGCRAVLAVVADRDRAVASEGDLEFLSVFASIASVLLENAEYHASLAQQHQLLQSVQDSMTEGLTVVDGTGHVRLFNRPGKPHEFIQGEPTGQHILDFLGGLGQQMEDRAVLDTVEQVLERSVALPHPFWVTMASDSGPVHLAITAFPVPAQGDEEWTGFLVRDATPERELERQKDLFISTAAHELRTPMTSMLGFSELLLKRDPPEAKRRQWLELLHGQTQRLSGVVNDMLDVSRMQTGRTSVSLEPLSVEPLFEEAATVVRPGSEDHDLVVISSADMPRVMADRDKLVQVLVNLLENAVKYSPAGGRVVLSAHREPESRRVVLTVADQGIGIAPEDQRKLFTSFGRVERAETRGISGTGLGLYIVRESVRLMNGEVWLRSAVNEGSTFFVGLPEAGQRAET